MTDGGDRGEKRSGNEKQVVRVDRRRRRLYDAPLESPPTAEDGEPPSTAEPRSASDSIPDGEKLPGHQAPGLRPADRATDVIQKHMLVSMGIGAIPLPILDFAALTLLQVRMVRVIAETYGAPFSAERTKAIIASLVGGVLPPAFSWGSFGGLLKAIPVFGHLLGAVMMPTAAAASTYAVGKVFVQHFESGGTILNLDPDQMREFYRSLHSQGRELANRMGRHIS